MGLNDNIGVISSFFNGVPLTEAFISSGKDAVDMAITMLGIVPIWCGMLNIAEKAGITAGISKILDPAVGRLFPERMNGGCKQCDDRKGVHCLLFLLVVLKSGGQRPHSRSRLPSVAVGLKCQAQPQSYGIIVTAHGIERFYGGLQAPGEVTAHVEVLHVGIHMGIHDVQQVECGG